jgi:tellurite resistance protein TerC
MSFTSQLLRGLRLTLLLWLLTVVVITLPMLGLARLVAPDGASGSLQRRDGVVVGARLIAEFHWLLGVFAVFLIITGLRMLTARDEHWDPAKSRLLRWCRGLVPIVDQYHGQRLFVRVPRAAGTVLALTPLAVALVMVEAADVVFAVDSIPAIFAITGDPFLVFTSNVFAILGLRSLYFLLAGAADKFHMLKYGLGIVLVFVGVKMTMPVSWYPASWEGHFPMGWSLAFIVTMIAGSMVASVVWPKRHAAH